MGLKIALETERGEKLDMVMDPTNLLHRLLRSYYDDSHQCVRFIDIYGHTIFNRLQMGPFINEWKQMTNMAQTDEERNLLARIQDLASRCQKEPHTYLKFYGD